MTRCQHCNKLAHSEDLYVYYQQEDFEKVVELTELSNWTPAYMYSQNQLDKSSPGEYGKLKCGDIYIHFVSTNLLPKSTNSVI